MNIEADFNYRKPLKENEAKPAFGLSEPDESMPDHKSYKKVVHDARESNFDITMGGFELIKHCLLYTSPSPRDKRQSRMPSSA